MARIDLMHQDLVREVFKESMNTILARESRYGSGSVPLAGALMALFPDGVTLSTEADFTRFWLLSTTVAKLNRYCQSFEEGGDLDSIHDAGNYAKLLEAYDRQIDGELPVMDVPSILGTERGW